MSAILIYALLWLSFGLFHSLLTIPAIKARLAPLLGRNYRFGYNVFSVAHIAVVFLIGLRLLDTSRFASLSTWPFVASSFFLTLFGVALMLMSLRQYDLGQFSGLTQWRAAHGDKRSIDLEPLNITGLNASVRHPLYSGLLLFAWGNAVSSFGLWTAIFSSIYIIVGAHHEENQLIKIYGDDYINYKTRVPAFFPRLKHD